MKHNYTYGRVGIPIYTYQPKTNACHVALWFVGAAAAAAMFLITWGVTA